jgi:hypothetical protein
MSQGHDKGVSAFLKECKTAGGSAELGLGVGD